MKVIARVIALGSILVSGTIIINAVFSMLDSSDIAKNGFANVLNSNECALILFVIGIAMMMVGIIGIAYNCLYLKEVD